MPLISKLEYERIQRTRVQAYIEGHCIFTANLEDYDDLESCVNERWVYPNRFSDGREYPGDDLAVWFRGKLRAVVNAGPDGQVQATFF
jgi:hypothetical protein